MPPAIARKAGPSDVLPGVTCPCSCSSALGSKVWQHRLVSLFPLVRECRFHVMAPHKYEKMHQHPPDSPSEDSLGYYSRETPCSETGSRRKAVWAVCILLGISMALNVLLFAQLHYHFPSRKEYRGIGKRATQFFSTNV